MQLSPFSLPGRFYRGNLHTHSTLSDGELTPEQVCGFYRQAGYNFLALTDHFLDRYGFPVADTRLFRGDGFTTLIGAELHAPETELNGLWHILAVGLPLDFAPTGAAETGPQLAARAMAAGAFVAAAHPGWYALTETDMNRLGQVDAVEVFNGTSCDHNDKPDGWHLLDILLARGRRMNAIATDDAHFYPDRHDYQRGWVHVRSEANEPEALLAALKAGAFYSSTGPAIYDVELLAGNHMRVRCSPAERVFVTGSGSWAVRVGGIGLTDVELDLSPLAGSPFMRVTVRDAHGGRAWSNPYWL